MQTPFTTVTFALFDQRSGGDSRSEQLTVNAHTLDATAPSILILQGARRFVAFPVDLIN